ncbi:hypothetical protein [Streptomyces sp. BK340]|nr:hypothetical protein [Streptomyces sp. BK340]
MASDDGCQHRLDSPRHLGSAPLWTHPAEKLDDVGDINRLG